MRLKYVCLALLFTSSCANLQKIMYPGGKDSASRSLSGEDAIISCNNTGDEEAITEALDDRSFIQLQDALKDCDLTDQYNLHNHLARTNGRAESLLEMAEFFTSKGATPQELDPTNPSEEYKKRDINISILGLRGPLQTTLSSGNSTLAGYYLQKMSAEDVAKGSLGFRGITPSAVSTFEKTYADLQVLSHIQNAPAIYRAVSLAIKRNDDLCREKKESNCKAAKHLRMELDTMHEGIKEISFSKACIAQMTYLDHKELMDEQMKLGMKTKVAAAETYDKHATTVQRARRELRTYKNIYQGETGKSLDLSHCQ